MKKLLVWTNGKKTVIGLVLYFLVGGFRQIGMLDEATANQLMLFADAIIGIGVLHKIKKQVL